MPSKDHRPVRSPSVTPLWQRLYRMLSHEIRSGQFPPGALLPTESELMGREELSRHTVRRALGELVTEGLIERIPHIGSRVLNRDQHSGKKTLSIKYPDFLSPGNSPQTCERIICDEETAACTGFALLSPLIRLSFTSGGTPDAPSWARTVIWMSDLLSNLPQILAARPNVSLPSLLEQSTGVQIASDEIFCRLAPAEEGTGASLIIRHSYADKRKKMLLVTETRLPAGETHRILTLQLVQNTTSGDN